MKRRYALATLVCSTLCHVIVTVCQLNVISRHTSRLFAINTTLSRLPRHGLLRIWRTYWLACRLRLHCIATTSAAWPVWLSYRHRFYHATAALRLRIPVTPLLHVHTTPTVCHVFYVYYWSPPRRSYYHAFVCYACRHLFTTFVVLLATPRLLCRRAINAYCHASIGFRRLSFIFVVLTL